MAYPQPAESASTNKRDVVDVDVLGMVAIYVEDLERAPLALRTRQAYASHVEGYGRWLTGRATAALARDVCHGHRGELRQRYRQGQEEQLCALGLIVNAIVLYNTIYTQRALDHLTEQGLTIEDADLQRLSPLATDHITLTGRYRIVLPEQLRDRGAYRELNTTPALAA